MAKDPFDKENIDGRMWRLNIALYEAAKWLEERAEQTWDQYQANGCWDGTDVIDMEAEQVNSSRVSYATGMYMLTGVTKCSLGSEDPALSPYDEFGNVVAVCTNGMLLSHEKDWSAPYFENSPEKANICRLFHKVYGHELNYDLDALTSIGEVEVNLVAELSLSLYLQPELEPRKLTFPHSVFCRRKWNDHNAFEHLTPKERDYARLLNEKLQTASAWIEEQARRCEEEYRAMGGVDGQTVQDSAYDNAYENYELFVTVSGSVGEEHPEYDEGFNDWIVSYNSSIAKESQRICGRARNLFYDDRYRCYFPHRKQITPDNNLWSLRHQELKTWHRPDGCDENNIIYTCDLFWNILCQAGHDWFKLLSISDLQIKVVFLQRRIIQI